MEDPNTNLITQYGLCLLVVVVAVLGLVLHQKLDPPCAIHWCVSLIVLTCMVNTTSCPIRLYITLATACGMNLSRN